MLSSEWLKSIVDEWPSFEISHCPPARVSREEKDRSGLKQTFMRIRQAYYELAKVLG